VETDHARKCFLSFRDLTLGTVPDILNPVSGIKLRAILKDFKAGKLTENEAMASLGLPAEVGLDFAQVDIHRAVRKGFPEVIFGAGKTPDQVSRIARAILDHSDQVLITRISLDHVRVLKKSFKKLVYNSLAGTVVIEKKPLPKNPGKILVVSAGTSDAPVAEEAFVTAEVMGNQVGKINDVGVAGIHRILSRVSQLREANVIVVVAGMEGALPSVVAGLVSRPVIAVPTSVGYGASFGGVAALLGMLNSCGSGVTVVNIDNGFGAGYAASQINALAAKGNRDGK
jgi:NCAIR mutase (PurE)-related protein